jgi:RND family efflux transporter MFP subunit
MSLDQRENDLRLQISDLKFEITSHLQSKARIMWRVITRYIPTTKFAIAVAGIIVVTLLLLILAGVFHAKVGEVSTEGRSPSSAELPTTDVRLIRRPRFETAVGTVKSTHESAVASKLLARVVEVNVKAGQAVNQGDVLVRLDDADLQARLKQVSAAETTARARKDQAVADFSRSESLIAKKAISQAAYDQALAATKAATSELERAEQAVREATVMLDYATIRAPLSGIIVDKRLEPGDTVTPGQILLTLYDPTRMQLVASVRESLAQRLKVGETVAARLESLDKDCQATVSEIVPEAAAASRSFTVKVTGPCPPGVYSGMFGRLIIPLAEEEIVVVPATAVRRIGQLTMVDVVRDGETQPRSIQVGRHIGTDLEVLSGLRPREKVVVVSH